MNSIEELSIETETSQRSGLATAALISSLIVCCPIATIVGPILGIISLATLKGRSGKGFAWTAIVVGLISTVLWIGAGVFFGQMAFKFIGQVGETTTNTPTKSSRPICHPPRWTCTFVTATRPSRPPPHRPPCPPVRSP